MQYYVVQKNAKDGTFSEYLRVFIWPWSPLFSVWPDWAGSSPMGWFRGLRGRQNLAWAGGWLGWLLHKMNFLGPGIFLLFSTKNWGLASWAGFRIVRAGSLEKVWSHWTLTLLLLHLLAGSQSQHTKSTYFVIQPIQRQDYFCQVRFYELLHFLLEMSKFKSSCLKPRQNFWEG